MRVRKPRRINEYLEGLADFLNSTAPGATEKQWDSFCRRIKKHPTVGSYFFRSCDRDESGRFINPERISLGEARNIRAEIHDDLAYLRTTEELNMPYGPLAASLTALRLPMLYQCNSLKGKPRPGQAILRSHGKRWVTKAQPIAENTREQLYGILATALIEGSLNRLQVCLWCGKYLAVKDRKRRFAPTRVARTTILIGKKKSLRI